jgi:hypothetical protein
MPVDPVIDARLRRIARRQHAAAHREQLLAAGVTRAQIATRVQRGEWQRPFRSVYILGDPALIPLAMESAVLLCFGEDAVLNDRVAGFLWGQIDRRPSVIDVAVPRTRVRPRPGVRIHLIQLLNAKDVRYQHGLRLTGPARTLIDLATHAASSELEHITGESVAKRLLTEHDLIEALDRAPQNHPGAARIRARLAEDRELLLNTRSVAERIAYPLILDAGLPRPGLNELVEGQRVDMYWPRQKLIVEVDSFQFHKSRQAFENDRRRDQILTAAGHTVIRITWHQLTREPYRVIATIAQALTRAERVAA